ncbi:F-box domain-containing protein [Mycena venus]|uniref:F-box domain-containing protein n=1 Tax=Mycena venus TaxID=2733690 RepID=A0A8H6YKY0_9AGAR|nr:F-box domain-containing protein [Mycena venus]
MKLFPARLLAKATASQRRVTNALPAELLIEIASHLTWAIDVLNFSLTSSQLRNILLPQMYKSIYLFGGAWTGTLEMLAKRPELCVHVRRLGVDLIYEALRPERYEEGDIGQIATLIQKALEGFSNLQTFTWSGKRLPPEYLFRAMRDACPQLKNIHCRAKSIQFDPESELFKFDDLTRFSLWVAYEAETDEPLIWQEIPVQLCDMLLQRCPDLVSLSIRLQSMHSIMVHQLDTLLSGVWPKLEYFDLDIEVIDSDPISFWPPLGTLSFLSAHPCITHLGLTAYSIFPMVFFREHLPSCFEPDASSEFTYFEGLLQHLAGLPNPAALKILVLSTVVTETSLERMLPVFWGLTSLKELAIEFAEIEAPCAAIHHIVSACPNLTKFHVKFCETTFTSSQLIEMSAQLKHLARLRCLHFDKVFSATSGTMLNAALILLGNIPSLQEICILNFMAHNWYQRGHYMTLTGARGRKLIAARESGLDRDYPKGKFLSRIYPRGKFSRTFRYSLERDVLGSISKKFKRIRR